MMSVIGRTSVALSTASSVGGDLRMNWGLHGEKPLLISGVGLGHTEMWFCLLFCVGVKLGHSY